jgi:molecular chaperone DnaK
MANIVGIDLGTTFSAVAHIDETGRPRIVHNSLGQNITPSVVSFEDPSRPVVGEEARKALGIDPWVLYRFKREMGTGTRYQCGTLSLTPTDLSALVLKKLVTDASAAIGPISEAVVTIPANFSSEAREATMSAAKAAGLNISCIINEPTAAALYYAFKNNGALNGTYAVYDLGGGTFDISIISVNGQNVEVVTSSGVASLGGMDFDKEVRKFVLEKYKSASGEEPDEEIFSLNDAEARKITLSSMEKTVIRVGRSKNVTLTRSDLEALVSARVTQAEMLCEAALDEAKLKPAQISKVFLVGGSTRMPCVRESVRRVFKQEPEASVNVDEVVALGAALYTALKSKSGALTVAQKAAVSGLKVQERTSRYFGTTSLRHNEERGKRELGNTIIIPKNSLLPAKVTESFYTVSDGQQAVSCRITESQNEEVDLKFVKIIDEMELKLPPNRPAGREIRVTYSYDENQIMNCEFHDVESGKKVEKRLDMKGRGASGVDIEAFIIE